MNSEAEKKVDEKIEEETQGEEKIEKWKRGKGKGKACKHWGTSFVVWACSLFRACSLFKAFYPSFPPSSFGLSRSFGISRWSLNL